MRCEIEQLSVPMDSWMDSWLDIWYSPCRGHSTKKKNRETQPQAHK